MAYDEQGDYFLCHEGQMLVRISDTPETAKDGSTRTISHYRCENCSNCPNRAACCKAKDPQTQKQLVICWEKERFRKASLERISSEEGKLLRVNRSIQAEGSFGQLKHNRSFKRFLTAGTVKVETELYLLALSQNILKLIAKRNKKCMQTHLLTPKALLKF